ncbi:PD-(D/E)XK nuclease family protein [Campylobacter sp. MOP7]|uniref:PDDEXK-like family protein n=1 Tax=Campylobacter canis TaxID=3378588 RepID=UPI00387E6B61
METKVDCVEPNFTKFFEEFNGVLKNYNEQENKRRIRGLHDYNIFTTLLKESDEVRLHSRFLYSLLNLEGGHYQDDLFLQLFLKNIGEQDWLDTKGAKVFKEYGNIDIYITNEAKHIILENKIYANDQKEQIERYINFLFGQNNINCNKQERQDPEILVLFLSPFGRSASEYSLGNYELKNGKLTCGKFSARYKEISYQSDILNWLNECEKEVENLTDLAVFIKHYRQVVLSITNQKQGKKMDEILDKIIKNYGIAREINANFDQAKQFMILNFLEKIEKERKLEDQFEDKIVSYKLDKLEFNKPLFTIRDKNCGDNGFVFALEIENLSRIYLSIKHKQNIKINYQSLENTAYKELQSKVEKDRGKIEKDSERIAWEYISKDIDIADEIHKNEDEFYKLILESLLGFVKYYEEEIRAINNQASQQ